MEFRGGFLKTPNSKLGTEGGLMNKGLHGRIGERTKVKGERREDKEF